jgi:hypothetical protein
MISNFEIEDICRDLKLDCEGVYSKDRLPKYRTNGGYYVNLQDFNDGNGTHFTFFFIEPKANPIYFDSFGMPPPIEVDEFLGSSKEIMYNNRDIQDLKSQKCGWFCIALHYFLTYEQDSRKSLEENYSNFLSSWSVDTSNNDKILNQYLKGRTIT